LIYLLLEDFATGDVEGTDKNAWSFEEIPHSISTPDACVSPAGLEPAHGKEEEGVIFDRADCEPVARSQANEIIFSENIS